MLRDYVDFRYQGWPMNYINGAYSGPTSRFWFDHVPFEIRSQTPQAGIEVLGVSVEDGADSVADYRVCWLTRDLGMWMAHVGTLAQFELSVMGEQWMEPDPGEAEG